MEFNIKKGATLPYIEVDYIKDGRVGYDHFKTNLSDATIYFYMKNIETGNYKIARGSAFFDSEKFKIYYQFSKKNTSDVARFEGEFKIETEQGLVDLPIRDKIYINVLNSFSDNNFCCGVNQNINPPAPTPALPGIYYGKLNSETLSSSDIPNLEFIYTNDPTSNYVNVASGLGYGYIVIPNNLTQPTAFRDSTGGCFGFNIPINNIGTINLVDENGFLVTYNIYRTFYSFNGESNIWMCN